MGTVQDKVTETTKEDKQKKNGESSARKSFSTETQPGKLYLCATPIGNLEDITMRVIRTLKEVDLIAAEDTRGSIKLLNHFDIHTPMTSYHEYNRIEKAHALIAKMRAGSNVALITDAGTPAISDPGEDLVRLSMEAGIEVTSLPGACACVTALTLSGLPTRRFCFEAFLPSDKKERRQILEELKTETRTTILYEAPHRLVRTLEELYEALGDRRATICRELTKKHETVFATTLAQALTWYRKNAPRGECVIVMEGCSRRELEREEQRQWEEMSIQEHVALYEAQGMERKEAMKQTAKDRGISKREVYAALLQKD
ncbi:MAG: 16S rRNA (cytidine(1402)-2'-O)-methyltransferase [Clostridiales bacterium]|nr:16S rRNA (cytidine(1402)-2'-O)-methyltransferase [Clostridiales bacterium]